MPSFQHGTVEIAFLDEGVGEPIVLVHGFASNKEVNWVQPGWVATLTSAGWRVIALDNRGHGQSSKFYEPANYHTSRMAEDVVALLDHLNLPRADMMGYSMGARIVAYLALGQPQRVRSTILGGLGMSLIEGAGLSERLAEALEARDLEEIASERGRQFWAFAEQTKSDLKALAACIRSSRAPITAEALGRLTCPVLVVVGEEDVIGGGAEALAALMPNARAFTVPKRDHMRTVGDKVYRQAVLEFLRTRP